MTDNGEHQRTIVHIEAEMGSSIFDVHMENCDPAQLFAIAGIIETNARVALAGQMAEQEARHRRGSPLVSLEGGVLS